MSLALVVCPLVAVSAPTQGGSAPAISSRGSDESVVVTASHAATSLAETPASVSVVTAEQIAAQGATSVVDVLRTVPGLYVDQPGGRGSRASVIVRGLDPNHTLVMIDGIHVNDPTNSFGGSFDFSTLDVQAIDRIEVVRGPLSAIHASGALGGTIHIVTRRGGKDDKARVTAAGGRFGYLRTTATLGGTRGPVDFAVTGGFAQEDDDASAGRFDAASFNANLGTELPYGGELRGVLRYVNSENAAFPEYSGGVELAVRRALEERAIREFTAGLNYDQPLTGRLKIAISSSHYRRRENRESPGLAPGIGGPEIPAEKARDRFQATELRLATDARLPWGLGLAAGADVTWEDGESSGLEASWSASRASGGPFLDAHWASPWGLRLEAGARAYFVDDGTATRYAPRVGVLYPLPELPVQLRANWGQGFKLPSFFALNHPQVGNPDLLPEKSEGYDLGVVAKFLDGNLQLDLTWFQIAVRDFVDFDNTSFRLVNRQHLDTRGFELEAKFSPTESLFFSAHVSHADARIRQTESGANDIPMRRPRWRGQAAVEWQPHPRLLLRVQALLVGKVNDSSNATGMVSLDDWQRVDLAAHYQVRDWLTLTLGIDNLLDEDYEQAVGFPAPRIRPRGGVEVSF